MNLSDQELERLWRVYTVPQLAELAKCSQEEMGAILDAARRRGVQLPTPEQQRRSWRGLSNTLKMREAARELMSKAAEIVDDIEVHDPRAKSQHAKSCADIAHSLLNMAEREEDREEAARQRNIKPVIDREELLEKVRRATASAEKELDS